MLKIIRHNLDIYFMILACLNFAFMGACAKILSDEMSSIEIMFFRNICGVIFLSYMIFKHKAHRGGGHLGLLIFRGVMGTIALYMFFYNIANISLGGAFAFQKTGPIFIAIISFFLFKENIGLKGGVAILIAFLSVLLIFQPWANTHNHTGIDLKNSCIGLLSGFLGALALTSVRQLRKYYPTEIIALSFVFLGTILPLFSMIIAEFYAPSELDFLIAKFKMPSSFVSWVLLAIIGILGTLYQIQVTKAYGVAKKAGVIAGISYMDVVFSLILGMFLGDDLPSFMVFIGIIGIILSGLLLAKKGKK